MSRYTRVYIGPYIKIQLKKTSVAIQITACNNPLCKYFNRNTQWQFCSECGAATVKKTIWEERYFYYNDLDQNKTHHGLPEQSVDRYCALLYDCVCTLKMGEEILIPNQATQNQILWPGIVSGPSCECSLEDLDVPKAKQGFLEDHADALEIFKSKLGAENIELKFGIVAFE